jgi:capsular polysaccharide biosynthesis protein
MESLRPRHLTEFLEILWRRKRLLLLMALVMLIATLIVIRRIPNMYESRALVVVNLRGDEQGLSETVRFSRLRQEMVSHNTLVTLVRKYNLYPNLKETEEAAQSLQKALKVEVRMRSYSPQLPESVFISHRYPDPKIAQAVVTDLVKMFDRGNELMRIEAAAEAERLIHQIAEVEARLKELGPKLDLNALRLEALSRSSVRSQSATDPGVFD